MKKLLSIVAAILFAATTFAKESELKDVTLVTNGSGKTKQEAVNLALRSALEQTFGTFVSANTQIVNDKLTKDEIVSISTGNIKNYKELSSAVLPSGQFAVVVQSTISLTKLTTYAQSHGSKCELAGATFAQNMKLRELNKENERKVMRTLKEQLSKLENSLYDISIETGTPRIHDGGYYAIPVELTLKGNKNTEAYMDLYFSTLRSVCLSEDEINDYNRTGDKYYPLTLNCCGTIGNFRNESPFAIGPGLNNMLKGIKICIHGKSNWYYQFDAHLIEALNLSQKVYRVGADKSYESWNKEVNLPYNRRRMFDYSKFVPLRQGKKRIYQNITRFTVDLIVSKSEMESISNIEVIVP